MSAADRNDTRGATSRGAKGTAQLAKPPWATRAGGCSLLFSVGIAPRTCWEVGGNLPALKSQWVAENNCGGIITLSWRATSPMLAECGL